MYPASEHMLEHIPQDLLPPAEFDNNLNLSLDMLATSEVNMFGLDVGLDENIFAFDNSSWSCLELPTSFEPEGAPFYGTDQGAVDPVAQMYEESLAICPESLTTCDVADAVIAHDFT